MIALMAIFPPFGFLVERVHRVNLLIYEAMAMDEPDRCQIVNERGLGDIQYTNTLVKFYSCIYNTSIHSKRIFSERKFYSCVMEFEKVAV